MDWWGTLFGSNTDNVVLLPDTANQPDILKCVLSWIPIIELYSWRRVNKTWFQVCSAILDYAPPFIHHKLPALPPTMGVFGPAGAGKTSFCYLLTQGKELDDSVLDLEEDNRRRQLDFDAGGGFMKYHDDCPDKAGNVRECNFGVWNLILPKPDDPSNRTSRWANLLILMYSVTDPTSLSQIEAMEQVLRQNLDPTEYRGVLVASKIDLVDERIISRKQGEELASKIGWGYAEVANQNSLSVRRAFIQVVNFCWSDPPNTKPRGQGWCSIL